MLISQLQGEAQRGARMFTLYIVFSTSAYSVRTSRTLSGPDRKSRIEAMLQLLPLATPKIQHDAMPHVR